MLAVIFEKLNPHENYLPIGQNEYSGIILNQPGNILEKKVL